MIPKIHINDRYDKKKKPYERSNSTYSLMVTNLRPIQKDGNYTRFWKSSKLSFAH